MNATNYNNKDLAIEKMMNALFDSEVGTGETLASMTIDEFSSTTTVEELVEAWATVYKVREDDTVTRSNAEEGTSVE